jgi:transcriptional regulator with XRE-family HTH domain
MARRTRRTYPDLDAFFDETGTLQAEFAARINKSQSYVSRLRNREIEPSLTDALVIMREAGVPLESLIRRAEAVART